MPVLELGVLEGKSPKPYQPYPFKVRRLGGGQPDLVCVPWGDEGHYVPRWRIQEFFIERFNQPFNRCN